ncbi:GM11328 [Drosophila sechellia]|uniref:GM11328 n=1 Tax=Drosophila sechellia TaxID=7238 RepID=B4IDN7_DROSE|nr:GM11328 [Drosophila sechellia]
MTPPRLSRYLMAVRGGRDGEQHSKNSQTDEEKQRDRQRNEREAKKEEQDAINYKRDKGATARPVCWTLKIRRPAEAGRAAAAAPAAAATAAAPAKQQHQQHQQQREHLQQQHRDQQQSSEKSPPTSSSAAAAHQTHPHSQQQQQRQHLHLQQQHLQQQQQQQQQQSTGSGSSNTPVTPKLQTPPPKRSLPPAFRSRSIEREIFYERKRFSQPETGEIKELDSTTSSSSTQQTFPGSAVGAGRAAAAAVPGSGTAVAVAVAGAGAGQSATLAGPPATAAAATAAIIPILPLGVATLRDDSTESEQSVTCAHNQLDAYHRIMTISEDAALALAGLPPIDLEIKALSLMRSGASKQEAHEWLTGEWQSRWQTSRRGRWTHQLIPELTVWAECQHKCLDYHLTQFLTDHGCFRAYLLRFRHVESARCLFCVDGEETAEHVLMHCSRFTAEREQLKTLSGTPLSPSGLFAAMLANSEAWELGHSLIINMMKRVRSDEMANRVDA